MFNSKRTSFNKGLWTIQGTRCVAIRKHNLLFNSYRSIFSLKFRFRQICFIEKHAIVMYILFSKTCNIINLNKISLYLFVLMLKIEIDNLPEEFRNPRWCLTVLLDCSYNWFGCKIFDCIPYGMRKIKKAFVPSPNNLRLSIASCRN